MDAKSFGRLLRDEDFLDVKLSEKPCCERVVWRELNESEKQATKKIKSIMSTVDVSGKPPFSFEYSVPRISFSGEERFSTRMIYAFSGLYQHAFDVDSEEFLPDDQLMAYRDLGINGIWMQGMLSSLTEFKFDPSISLGYEKRIERVRALTERLDKFGIKLYLYLNEPRCMPLAFFDAHPEIKGHVNGEDACLCTSVEAVKDYFDENDHTNIIIVKGDKK